MKIGIVSTYRVECGIATYTDHLIQHFPSGDPIVFANNLGQLTDTESCSNHPYIRCWSRTGDFEELTKQILDSGVKIVHFQHEFGLFQNNDAFCRMLKSLRERSIAVIVTFHTVFSDPFQGNDKIVKINEYANALFVHDEDAKKYLGLNKTIVIPHGSLKVTPLDKRIARKHLNIKDNDIILLSLGFITPNKAALDSVAAVVRLRDEIPNLKLLIVGMPVVHGNSFGNLEYCLKIFQRLKALNAFDVVSVFPKFVSENDIHYYASAADIAIENYHKTHFSTSGMSHLVMSYGLPNISSRAFILHDLDDQRSLKYDIGNIEQMAAHLRTLIKDKNLREQMSRNCLKYTEEVSWENIAKRHLKLYEELTPRT